MKDLTNGKSKWTRKINSSKRIKRASTLLEPERITRPRSKEISLTKVENIGKERHIVKNPREAVASEIHLIEDDMQDTI